MQDGNITFWLVVGFGVLGTMISMVTFALAFRKAGPNEALLVYGFRGTRMVVGRGIVVLPLVETYRRLSLELMSFDFTAQQNLYSSQGVPVTVEAVVAIKVKADPQSIFAASERLLTKEPDERKNLIGLVIEGHLRSTFAQLTTEDILKAQQTVSDRVASTCVDDLNKIGLEIVSFSIRRVRGQSAVSGAKADVVTA